MKYLLFGAVVLLSLIASTKAQSDAIFEGVSFNEDVQRRFHLDTNGVIEVATDIRFKPLTSADAKAYYHVIPSTLEDHIVSVTAVLSSTQEDAIVTRVTSVPSELQSVIDKKGASDVIIFKIVTSGETTGKGVLSLTLKELYKKRRTPFPSTVAIKDDQSIKFVDSNGLYFVSLYPTKTQKTQFNFNALSFIFHTADPTAEKKQKYVKYGPFKNVEALSYSEVMLHYKSNAPLPIFHEVRKQIEVSHWGNILVDEYYELFNNAAGIKGEFGRVDYQHWNTQIAQYAIKSLQTSLPRYIRGLYYWDFIGNISSSNAFRGDEEVSFKIEPRFPVFGQWKVDWSQGYTVNRKETIIKILIEFSYNMPTRYHLLQDASNRFILNYTFDFDMTEILAENYTLSIVLPEGAKDIKVHLPFEVESVTDSLYFSTLDYIGRPQIIIKKSNVISHLHRRAFQVSYEFSAQGMFIEPVYVIVFFFSCFLVAIIYARIDLSFKDDKKKKLF